MFKKETKVNLFSIKLKNIANKKCAPEKIPQHASLLASPIQTLRLSLFLVTCILYQK